MHENQFTVIVHDLEDGPKILTVDCDPSDIELEDPEYVFPERVTGDVQFSLVRPRVVSRGRLHTVGVTQCVRCLGEARIQIYAPVMSTYESDKEHRETRGAINPDEEIITPFNGDWIQPEEEFRESIMLELPTFPVCKSTCAGLCPKCGANLNDGPCGCENADQEVSSWKTALKSLKLPGEDNS